MIYKTQTSPPVFLRYNRSMFQKKGSALPVRLTEDEKNDLSIIARETGLTSSTLIRLLISALVKSYKRDNGKISLPISIEHIMHNS